MNFELLIQRISFYFIARTKENLINRFLYYIYIYIYICLEHHAEVTKKIDTVVKSRSRDPLQGFTFSPRSSRS